MSDTPQRRAAGLRGSLAALYELLSAPRFAIIVVLALALASIVGLIVIDQIPIRGQFARAHFAERRNDPLVWLLVHVVPESPFRCLTYRTLLALLSLSLLACTIKRWRGQWRQALQWRWPAAEFPSAGSVMWTTGAAGAPALTARFLRRRAFSVAQRDLAGGRDLLARRFAISRVGPLFIHVGFLMLIVGGLWMASRGSSRFVWLRAGDEVSLSGREAGLPAEERRLRLEDFRIAYGPGGQIADYFAKVSVHSRDRRLREAEIEVNRPLRESGYSIYQNSYRADPTRVESIDLVIDLAARRDAPAAESPAGDPHTRPPHGHMSAGFEEPLTIQVPWGRRVPLAPTTYAVEIDTFLADFRIAEGGVGLASAEHRNPAVHLRFFADGQPAGETWYFARHPEMPVGSGPEIPLRFAGYAPALETGLEIATHPGSAWVWAGIAVVTLGTMLAFLLRYERARVLLTPLPGGWQVRLQHIGAPPQAPEFVRADWERTATPLAIRLSRLLEPLGGPPVVSAGDAPRASGDEAPTRPGRDASRDPEHGGIS